MTRIIEARVIGNHAVMGRSTPAATDRPYLTVHEVLRARIRRAVNAEERSHTSGADIVLTSLRSFVWSLTYVIVTYDAVSYL